MKHEKSLKDWAKRFYDNFKDMMGIVKDKILEAYDEYKKLKEKAKDMAKDMAKKLFDEFLECVRSFDPVSYFPIS